MATTEDIAVEGSGEPGDPSQAEDRQRRSRVPLVVGVAILAVVAATVGVLAARGPDKNTIRGLFTLFDADVDGEPGNCRGTGGYDDFDDGVPVTVRDEKGKIVGSAFLRNASVEVIASRMAAHDDVPVEEAAGTVATSKGLACVLVFDVEVDDAEFYEIEVGRRGKSSYSKQQLEEEEWIVGLSLGR